MPGPLYGKLAIVTGAGSGIGRAICRALYRDGAAVVAADKHLDAVKETASLLGPDSTACQLDVTSADNVSKVLNDTLEKYKRPPSILVNSAGIIRDAYLLKMTKVDFDSVIDTNLKGTFLTMQHFANAMVQYKISGSIVNLSSIVAKITNVGQANYASSKAGVSAITQVASKELGKFNIRVNAVLPGFIDTPMVATIPDDAKKKALENCVLGRLGTPDEVGEVVAFLASEKSSFVNGALIEVTGGMLAN